MADTFKRLAALRPANTSEAELYLVGTGKQAIANLTICNQDSTSHTFSIAQTDTSGAATGEDWIYSEHIIMANGTIQLTGLSMNDGESIRVKASIADKISFILSGLEIG